MSGSTQTFKEAFFSLYLPFIVLFLALVAGGTCLNAGPFFPVGFAGLFMIAFAIYFIVYIFKKRNEVEELNKKLNAAYMSNESITKKYKSDLEKKNEDLAELKAEVGMLKVSLSSCEKELNKTEEVKAEEPVKEKKKTTSKKK